MNLRRRIQSLQTYLNQRREILRFDQVPDPRGRRGQRWKLPALLSTALMSLALLARSMRRAEQLSEELSSARMLRRLGVRRRLPDSTLGDVLSAVAPQALLDHLHWQVRAEHRRKALEPTVLPVGVVAIDGKTPAVLKEAANPYCQLQSGDDEKERYVYRVLNATLISCSATVCIHQKPIPAQTNEMGAFADFFDEMDSIYGRSNIYKVITTDAGVLSQEHCRKLDKADYGYILALKGNNPDLEQEARRVFGKIITIQPPEVEQGWELDSSRGWVKRQLWTTTQMAGWPGWVHMRQTWFVRLWARNKKDDPPYLLEQRVYVTNLPTGHRIRGRIILDVIRAHWRIESVPQAHRETQRKERNHDIRLCA